MDYLVLARKYRPSSLAELVGQEHISRALSNAIEMKRFPQALLFCGARGTGKTSTARIVAKMLNCETGLTDRPCGGCAPCREIAAGGAVDVQELDAASNRGIDEIRELRSGVAFAPARDRFKVYIVDEAHMLTNEAANGFLKTLEEPPPHVVFVLATTDPQRLPATIRSRCQRYDFRRVKAQDVVARLASICQQEGVEADEEALFLVAREGDGSMRDSLSLLDQVINFGGRLLDADTVAGLLGVADRGRIHALLEALVRRDTAAALLALATAHDYGLDLRTLARNLAHEARDLLVVQLAGPAARQMVDRSESEVEALRLISRPASGGDLERLAHVLLEMAEQVAKARYPRLVLEMGVVRLCRAAAVADVAELAARVEALLASGGARLAAGPGRGGAGFGGAGSSMGGPSSASGGAGATGGDARKAGPVAPPGSARSGGGGWQGQAPQRGDASGQEAASRSAGAVPLNTTKPSVASPSVANPSVATPPAPPSPAAADAATLAVLTDADLPRLQALMARQPGGAVAASLLDSAVVQRCGGGQLVLGMANAFLLSQLASPAVLAQVADAAAALLGGAVQALAVEDGRAVTDSRAARQARRQLQTRQTREQRLRQAPEVLAVLQAFEGEIVQLYTDNDETLH